MKSVASLNPLRAVSQSAIESGLALSGLLLALTACATQRDGPPVRTDGVERRVTADAAGAPNGAGASDSSGGTGAGGGTDSAGNGNTDSGGQGAEDAGGSSADAGESSTAGGDAGATGNTAGTSGSGGDTVTGGTGGGESGSAGETTSAGTSSSGGTSGECGEVDCCPDDPDKDDPGVCGCGEPDTDTDDDGSSDCEDECPDDPDKTAPGACGCGYEDTPECAALKAALVHRYSFNGSGNIAVDSVGDADGLIVNTQLSGNGTLSLAGGSSDEYVNLPNGIISGFTSVTVEAWLTWNGGNAWQRIFDFGSSNQSEGTQGRGETYLYLIASTSGGRMRTAYTTSGLSGETWFDSATRSSSGVQRHVAVVADAGNTTLALYVNGSLDNSVTSFTGLLSDIQDVNNWIGRSQYSADPELSAVLEEFRIYDSALSNAEIEASYDAGPDAGFLSP